jgi:hypothetical protein
MKWKVLGVPAFAAGVSRGDLVYIYIEDETGETRPAIT